MASAERRLLSAKRLCSGRSRRREEFPEEMFADWAWSMLMLAYIAQGEGRTYATDRLYAAAGVAAPVGQRWVAYLVKEGMLSVADDVVRLTDAATARLDRYLDIVVDIAAGEAPV